MSLSSHLDREETIITPELTLEPLRRAHAEAMFELLSDTEIYRYLDYPPPASLEHLRNVYVQLEARASPDRNEAWLNWVIRPHDHPLIGYVQATVTSNHSAYVAYVLASQYWGRGYARKAMHAMLEHLASARRVARYMATVEAENGRSIRLLQHLGFHQAAPHELNDHRLAPTERMFIRTH